MHEALRLLAVSDRMSETRVDELRREVAKGVASAKAGRVKDGDAVIAKLDARLRKLERDRRGK